MYLVVRIIHGFERGTDLESVTIDRKRENKAYVSTSNEKTQLRITLQSKHSTCHNTTLLNNLAPSEHFRTSYLHLSDLHTVPVHKKNPNNPKNRTGSHHALMEAHGGGLRRILVLAFCVAGIWSAYIYQGILQETL